LESVQPRGAAEEPPPQHVFLYVLEVYLDREISLLYIPEVPLRESVDSRRVPLLA